METKIRVQRILRLNGIFGVAKPAAESSAQTVGRIKKYLINTCKDKGTGLLPPKEYKRLNKLIKVGHGGTLDPLATGVLVIGVGEGCKRLQEYLGKVTKVYRTTGRFGQAYDTYDQTGLVTEQKPFEHISREYLDTLLREKFSGNIMQNPPAFSALHVNGVRAYELARKKQKELLKNKEGEGEEKVIEGANYEEAVKLEARPITIHNIELTKFELPEFEIVVECGSGTYVRSLIHDIGKACDSVAAMFDLSREKQGSVSLEECLPIELFDKGADMEETLLRMEKAIQKHN